MALRISGAGVVVLVAALASCSGRSSGGTGANANGGMSGRTGGSAGAATSGSGATSENGENGGDEASGGNGGNGALVPDTIFTSLAMPDCDQGGDQHQIHGTLNGEAVDIHVSARGSDLIGSRFRTSVFESTYVYPLELTWSVQPAEDRPIPLSGGTLLMRDAQPFAGQSFCITAGEFGSRSTNIPLPESRQLLFHISGARAGDCKGQAVPVDLLGCILTNDTYFPTSLSVDFPVDPSRPNIEGTKALVDLTDEERAELCDWDALMLGGYGVTTDCRAIGASSVANYVDRAECLSAVFAHVCPGVTVADNVKCRVAKAPMHGCVYPMDACPTEGICN